VNASESADANTSLASVNDRDSPSYLVEYGFLQAPFGNVIDDNMYYADPGQKQRLDLVLHLTQFSQDVLILTGEEGSGKTTLAYQFLEQAHSSWKTCLISIGKTTGAIQLWRQIGDCFQLPIQSQILEQMIDEVKDHLHVRLSEPGPHILLVDDAHLLSAESLTILLQLAEIHDQSGKNQLHLLLLATPDIKHTLMAPEAAETRHAKIRKLEIPALSRTHADDLLSYRIAVAGCQEKIINDRVLARIYAESGGNPGKLCRAAHEYLSQKTTTGSLNSSSDTTDKSADMKTVFIVIAAFVAIGIYVFQDGIKQFFHSSAQKPVPVATVANEAPTELKTEKLELPQQPVTTNAISAAEGELAIMAEVNEENPIATSLNSPDSVSADPPQTDAVVAPEQPSPGSSSGKPNVVIGADNTRFDHLSRAVPDELESKRSQALEKIKSQLKKFEKKRREQINTESSPITALAQSADADSQEANADNVRPDSDMADGPVLFPAAPADSDIVDTKKPPSESHTTEAKSKSSPPANPHPSSVDSQAASSEAVPRLALPVARDEYWIKKQPGENFTLQLIGGYQIDTLHRFIKQHKLAANELSYYLSYNKQGKAWHSLIYGSYPDIESARKAAQALTQSTSIKQPWIRKFSKIHGDLRTR